jgi:U32 family peptidase
MNILAPIGNVNEVNSLLDIGADELYTGLTIGSINDLTNYTNARIKNNHNLIDWDQLKSVNEIIVARKSRLHLTLNSPIYSKEQFPWLETYVKKTIDTGIKSFIVNCPSMVQFLKDIDKKVNIKMSCLAVVLNSESAKFYHDMGASTIVFPRHVTFDEMRNIIKNNPKLKFEAMIANSRCRNMNGLCNFTHQMERKWFDIGSQKKKFSVLKKKVFGYYYQKIMPYVQNTKMAYKVFKKRAPCRDDYKIKISPENSKKRIIKKNLEDFYKPNMGKECGLCALYYLKQMSVSSVKIVGRGRAMNIKKEPAIMLKKAIKLLNKGISKEEYFVKVKKILKETTNVKCSPFNCHYPEVFYNQNSTFQKLYKK